MIKIGKNNKLNNFYKSPIIWFAIYIGIALAITFIVPFPLSLIVYIGIYLFLQTYRIKLIQNNSYHPDEFNKTNRDKENKKQNKFFKSLPNSLFGDKRSSQNSPQPLKFICMNCGKVHSDRSCPVCGSTAVKLG